MQRTKEEIEHLDPAYDKAKEALVERWGGWWHRRWQVFYDSDDRRALQLFCQETRLRRTKSYPSKLLRRMAPKENHGHGRYYGAYMPGSAERFLQEEGLFDHPRCFTLPRIFGPSSGAVLLMPYEHAVERLAEAHDEVSSLRESLSRYTLKLRIIAHPPYNQQTVGILIFSANDYTLQVVLEETADYVIPG